MSRSTVVNWLLDCVFPVRCLGCSVLERGYLCSRCIKTIPLRSSFECIGCKQPVPFGKTCGLCRPQNHLDALYVAANFTHPLLKKSIAHFKYQFIDELTSPLTHIIRRYIKRISRQKEFSIFIDQPTIVPVPLHYRRLNWRGFNQAELLATHLARHFQLPLELNTLQRIKSTKPQALLSEREDRIKNIEDIFICTRNVTASSILLIDDICTTGATLNECARVLKIRGAQRVSALVVARG